jgi:hypothetical protein
MYAVDPIGSCGQSAVQSASFRRDDPALLGEQLTEDQRTIRNTGSRMSTLPLAVGRCAARIFCTCPNRCLQSRNVGRIRNRHISPSLTSTLAGEPLEYLVAFDLRDFVRYWEPFLCAGERGARSKAHPAPASKFLSRNLAVELDPW